MAIKTFEGLPIVDQGGRDLISALDAKKISFPNDGADFGNSGDQLRSLGDGGVEWAAPGMPTYEQTEQAISDWLNEHPEATTTVTDGAITDAKLNDALKRELVYGFETVADMEAADTLKAGMICHTSGFNTSGDGGDTWYRVSSSGEANGVDVIQLQDGLFANAISLHNGDKAQSADESTINAMVKAASSYVAQEYFFTYGAPNYENQKWTNQKISCSVLSNLLIMGIPFENSPYCEEQTKFSTISGNYGFALYESKSDLIHGSEPLARLAAVKGFGFFPKTDYSNVKPGDVLFFKNTDGTGDQGWLDISHCEICVGYASKYSRVTDTNEKIICASAGFTSGLPVRFSERDLDDITNQRLVYCARFPINGVGFGLSDGNELIQITQGITDTITFSNRNTYSLCHIVLDVEVDQTNTNPSTITTRYGSVSKTYTLSKDTKKQTLSFIGIPNNNNIYVSFSNLLILNGSASVDELCKLNDRRYLYDAGSATPEAFISYLASKYQLTTGIYTLRLSTTALLNGENGYYEFKYNNVNKNFSLQKIGDANTSQQIIRVFFWDSSTQTYTRKNISIPFTS